MCLCIPNFPFRNTIVIDKDSNQEQLMARPCLVPVEYKNTKRPFVNAAHFPHHNYIHFRNTENLVHEELPAPPTFNGFVQGKYFGLGGSIGHVLRNKYLKHRQSGEDQIPGIKDQKSDNVVDNNEKK